MDGQERHCPVCGQPVGTVVRRHKTLGAWVPVWVGGPCHNPDCDAFVADGAVPLPKSAASRATAGGEDPGEPPAKDS
ncbi:hypothetical protein ABZT03_03475 [Streptomyces sp. NPDC005574]|uniref:hypothetical protein n=1 Tax=Streptomyces sp. NPDC005574 TaxID=3156891 RepID=UPI00339E1086